LPAPRGLITDRNDVILATNTASFKGSIIRENSINWETSLQKISHMINLEEDTLKLRLEPLSWLEPHYYF
jgi:cell division protein FtsI/penicillin-binding protein 2